MRSLIVLALALLVSGCGYKTTEFSRLQMTARGSNCRTAAILGLPWAFDGEVAIDGRLHSDELLGP